ncbi:hypothetical protein L202_01864 [Cryptococcus amylolentus CBS 6039]|uniref:Uncharacterized protein n=1 Tax=Cryptococcus amylolentus CBS 6039 TaxID=1295533 RepID=A0A1E3HYM4_9TREE|nr:hypothetical protein L202_01864 [Cryptococcus amylolentus CBS 6039]ODN81434.1 hypothetical protein L202_01864 [Cryptococcus amylolentus CBS 6039]
MTSAPISIVLGTALLINNMGYSALVGLGVLALIGPYQTFMFKRISRLRKAQTKVMDSRVRLLSEVLNNIRSVKLYAYEKLWADRIEDMRKEELQKRRSNSVGKSSLNMIVTFIPTLAAISNYITYSLSGHTLNAAVIFSSLQYFNIMRVPLTMLPQLLSSFSEGKVAIVYLRFLRSVYQLRSGVSLPVDVAFESTLLRGMESKCRPAFSMKTASPDKAGAKVDPNTASNTPFSLKNIDLQIPRGSLVCVVGSVGTGKTALLSGLLNEMKRTEGEVVFGGSVSYVPQHAWVQSGSIRDNVTFSSASGDVDLNRVEEVIGACALRRDVNMWPQGVLTEIGERGITLSGGQRQRICIARAAYSQASVVLLDDPLSAVDAHVGNHLLHNCILNGPLSHRTRVLVTHHLDMLHHADVILVMGKDEKGDGHIIQQGTYEQPMSASGTFQTLISQFGSTHDSSSSGESGGKDADGEAELVPKDDTEGEETDPTNKAEVKKLVIDEEWAQGTISWTSYRQYAQAIKSWALPPMVVSFLLLAQAATVFNSLFLGIGSEDKYPNLRQGEYMAIYGGKRFGAVFSTFLAAISASYTIFNRAWNGVTRSPTAWHDRNPTGRIINRLSNDVENLDDHVPDLWYLLANAVMSIFGTLALILYVYPWIALLFIPVYFFYTLAFIYYRITARDLQRLASLTRSHIYLNFGEQSADLIHLTGLPVIRAFHQQSRYNRKIKKSVDVEMSTVLCGAMTQNYWMGIRINFMSYLLILFVAIFGVVFRSSVSPSHFGVVLTYVIATSARNFEAKMVSAYSRNDAPADEDTDRVQAYGELTPEAPSHLPSDPDNSSGPWPPEGTISFQNVQLKYRSDLPLVLKGLTFYVNPGEKIGIIGRTGAGKSSIAQALFRTIEIASGKIVIDGRDLRGLGLDTLRQRLSIIPQDTFLFSGTIRENIDPTNTHSDAALNDALNLIHNVDSSSHLIRAKFGLDATVASEGSNFSAGERQLLALVRALVRGSKVLMLDEATSSVDPETDALIQRIIQSQFSNTTILSIVHRLQTVAYYDRILVMDAGKVAELDTPLHLFDQPGSIFRSLCDKSKITRTELLRIRRDAGLGDH